MLATIQFIILSSHFLSPNAKIKMYITIVLFVLCECETCSCTLRQECRLTILQSRVLRRVFRSKKDEVTEVGRTFHKQQFHNLY
jgi:hypothetical protein